MTLYMNGDTTAKSLCPMTTSRMPIPLAMSIYSIRFFIDSPPLILPLELECRHPLYTCLEAEQATCKGIRSQYGFVQTFTRRGDVKFIEVFSAKDAGGN